MFCKFGREMYCDLFEKLHCQKVTKTLELKPALKTFYHSCENSFFNGSICLIKSVEYLALLVLLQYFVKICGNWYFTVFMVFYSGRYRSDHYADPAKKFLSANVPEWGISEGKTATI